MTRPPPLRFTPTDSERAFEKWHANCGPNALAAILGLTLDEVHPHLEGFDQKHYTNPTMMFDALRSLKAKWKLSGKFTDWPAYGLCRVQWEGPWTNPGVPIRARYRHTHWVGACTAAPGNIGLFDVNAMHEGNPTGWISLASWTGILVPWILADIPKANGKWHLTHVIEIEL